MPVGGWNTDGLVVLSPLRTEARRSHARSLQATGHPVVFVGAGDGRPTVEIDSAAGIRQALEHLRSHGHSRVAFVAGDPLDRGDSALRLGAFRRELPALGLESDEELIEHGRHSEHGGYDAMRAILARGRAFTAVVASNDLSAIGAMRALAEAGRDVPGDVAVVGFDDHLMASAHVPPLTSVRYPLAEAGRRAVELLARCPGRGPLPARDDGHPAGARRPPFLRLPALRTGRPGDRRRRRDDPAGRRGGGRDGGGRAALGRGRDRGGGRGELQRAAGRAAEQPARGLCEGVRQGPDRAAAAARGLRRPGAPLAGRAVGAAARGAGPAAAAGGRLGRGDGRGPAALRAGGAQRERRPRGGATAAGRRRAGRSRGRARGAAAVRAGRGRDPRPARGARAGARAAAGVPRALRADGTRPRGVVARAAARRGAAGRRRARRPPAHARRPAFPPARLGRAALPRGPAAGAPGARARLRRPGRRHARAVCRRRAAARGRPRDGAPAGGRARADGDRRAHRPVQPPLLRAGAPARGRARPPLRPLGGARDDRRRPLQELQRPLRPPRGRRRAARGRGLPRRRRGPARGRGDALRRRGVRGPAFGDGRGGRPLRRREDPRGRRRAPGVPAPAHRERRRRGALRRGGRFGGRSWCGRTRRSTARSARAATGCRSVGLR